MSAPPVLELSGVCARYGMVQALWDVSLTVEPGETVALIGANGAGKTTLLRAIAGTVDVFAGDVRIAGETVTSHPSSRRLRRGIGWVPEGRELFARFTIKQNLYLSARLAGCRDREFSERLAEIVEVFPVIGDRLETPVGALSGGEQQMVAIARALVRQPRVILLDEPSAGLAPAVVLRLRDTLSYVHEGGVAVLVAEQNVGWLADIPGRAYTIRGGRVLEGGSMDLLRSRDALRAAYLGG